MSSNKSREYKIRSRRTVAVSIIAGILMLALLVRVGYIKGVHGEEYQQRAEAQQLSSTDVEIPALRGSILDRNGNVLAQSTRVYNVILDCQVLIEASESQQLSTLDQLVNTLKLQDDSPIRKFMTSEYESYRYMKLPEGKGISAAQMESIQQGIDKGKVVGVWFEEDENRQYVNDSLAAHVIGFNGTYGVEQYYNDQLEGTSGRKMVVAASGNSYVEEYLAPQNGDNLTLTIDSKVQYNIEQILQDAVQKTNALRGAVILMNSKTGALVAEAEVPTFNLNNVNEVSGLSKEYQQRYPDTSDQDYYPRIWNSWVISSTYEPGSTFKPVFAAAALNEAVINENTPFYCSGHYQIYDAEVNCANGEAHGQETISDIIRNSCNVGMAQISELLPTSKWLEYQEAFGLGTLTGIDISGEVGDNRSLIYLSEDEADALGLTNYMGPFEKATTSFGQGFRVTPIQQICAFNSIINGGEYLKPYVVSEIDDASGNAVSTRSKEVLRNTVSEEVSKKIRQYCLNVVEGEGTGALARVPGYHIGGKTGTGEKLGDDGQYVEGKYIVSFESFVPADDPEYVMLVILDETNTGSSHQIALLSGQIWESILPALGMYPDPSINADAPSPSTIDIRNYIGSEGGGNTSGSQSQDTGTDWTNTDSQDQSTDSTTGSDDTTTDDGTATYDGGSDGYSDQTDTGGDTTGQ